MPQSAIPVLSSWEDKVSVHSILGLFLSVELHQQGIRREGHGPGLSWAPSQNILASFWKIQISRLHYRGYVSFGYFIKKRYDKDMIISCAKQSDTANKKL